MSQFDVHSVGRHGGLVIDCQADLLAHLTTRFVVPLVWADGAPETDKRLRPRFDVGGETYVMATPLASSIPMRDLGAVVATLASDQHTVTGAIDVLLSGI